MSSNLYNKNLPVRKSMCNTCPFKEGSPYQWLEADLTESAISGKTRICHSTGENAINKKTGFKSHICRGARNIQLKTMCAMKIITKATDEAWNEARVSLGMKPQIIQNPSRSNE